MDTKYYLSLKVFNYKTFFAHKCNISHIWINFGLCWTYICKGMFVLEFHMNVPNLHFPCAQQHAPILTHMFMLCRGRCSHAGKFNYSGHTRAQIQLKELGKRTSGNQIFIQLFMQCTTFSEYIATGWWWKFYGHAFSLPILHVACQRRKAKNTNYIKQARRSLHLLSFSSVFWTLWRLTFLKRTKIFCRSASKTQRNPLYALDVIFPMWCARAEIFSATVVKRKRVSRSFPPSQSLFWQEQLLASARDSDDWLTSIFIKSLSYSRVVGSARVSKEISLSWDVVTKDFSPAPERVGF